MKPLSKDAQAVLDALRKSGPSAHDEARIASALRARLAQPPPPRGASTAAKGWLIGGTSLVLIGVAAFGWLRPGPSPSPAPAPALELTHVEPAVAPDVAPATSPPPPVPPVRGRPRPVIPAPAVDEPVTEAVVTPEASAAPAAAPLEDEVTLLVEARGALSQHQFERVLELAQRHALHYPTGMLSPEREKLRQRALCGLGREQELPAGVTCP